MRWIYCYAKGKIGSGPGTNPYFAGLCGCTALVAADDDPSGRNVSRGIVLLDHAVRDGLEGFITITGGKLMTYRLMAEWATDLICKKLNVNVPCTTASEKLPGSREDREEVEKKIISLPLAQRNSSIYRHGDLAERFSGNDVLENSLVCECEEVSVGEVKYALNELEVHNLVDLRRRTRVPEWVPVRENFVHAGLPD